MSDRVWLFPRNDSASHLSYSPVFFDIDVNHNVVDVGEKVAKHNLTECLQIEFGITVRTRCKDAASS